MLHLHYRYWNLSPEESAVLTELPFWLGAQKYFLNDDSPAALRFGVYAPNAQKVEVVFGLLWNLNDPNRTPLDRNNPAPLGKIAGGYIADDGFGIDPGRPVFELAREENGCWFSDPNDSRLADFDAWRGVPSMCRIPKHNGRGAYRTDVYSRAQLGYGDFDPKGAHYEGAISNLAGTKSCSLITDPNFVIDFEKEIREHEGKPTLFFPHSHFIPQEEFWKDEFTDGYVVPTDTKDLIIYQLHTASLGFGHEGVGTLDDAMGLLDHLVEIGVNAVEFLPMSEYGGKTETWGYSTSHFFAIEFSGGGRDKFKYFVKACHQRGLAVIFDVVYNHFAHEADRAEWLYDSDDHEKNFYYWYKGKPSDYAPALNGTGGYLDNLSTGFAPRYNEPYVGGMFVLSAASLLLGFHVDGFRADQTTSIHAYNVLHADGSAAPEANSAGCEFLQKWSKTLKTIDPNVMLMAEDHSGWDAVTKPVEEGGLGFDAIWYADYHHHLNGANYGENYAKLVPTAGFGGDGPLGIEVFSKALCASASDKIVYHISHDEAGNSGRDDPDPNRRSHRTLVLAVRGALNEQTRPVAESRARIAFGLTVCSPGTPMFLFGEEVGFVNDFLYDDVLRHREDLFGYKKTTGEKLFTFYQDMIRLRADCAALRSDRIDIVHTHDINRVLAFRRWTDLEELLVLVSLNNSPLEDYVLEHETIVAGRWQAVLNSDRSIYGGETDGTLTSERAVSEAGKLTRTLPPNTLIVLKRYE